MDGNVTFAFHEANPRRISRGVAGVRIKVYLDGVADDLIWMTKNDIQNNIVIFGVCDALTKGLSFYR